MCVGRNGSGGVERGSSGVTRSSPGALARMPGNNIFIFPDALIVTVNLRLVSIKLGGIFATLYWPGDFEQSGMSYAGVARDPEHSLCFEQILYTSVHGCRPWVLLLRMLLGGGRRGGAIKVPPCKVFHLHINSTLLRLNRKEIRLPFRLTG